MSLPEARTPGPNGWCAARSRRASHASAETSALPNVCPGSPGPRSARAALASLPPAKEARREASRGQERAGTRTAPRWSATPRAESGPETSCPCEGATSAREGAGPDAPARGTDDETCARGVSCYLAPGRHTLAKGYDNCVTGKVTRGLCADVANGNASDGSSVGYESERPRSVRAGREGRLPEAAGQAAASRGRGQEGTRAVPRR